LTKYTGHLAVTIDDDGPAVWGCAGDCTVETSGETVQKGGRTDISFCLPLFLLLPELAAPQVQVQADDDIRTSPFGRQLDRGRSEAIALEAWRAVFDKITSFEVVVIIGGSSSQWSHHEDR
jgi:hypothetical protein